MPSSSRDPERRRARARRWSTVRWVVVALGSATAVGQWGTGTVLVGAVLDVLLVSATYGVLLLMLPPLPTRFPHSAGQVAAAATSLVASLVTFLVVARWSAPAAWLLLAVAALTRPGWTLVKDRPAG